MNDEITAEAVRNEIHRGTAIVLRGLYPRADDANPTTGGQQR
jgi:hypothetical protein